MCSGNCAWGGAVLLKIPRRRLPGLPLTVGEQVGELAPSPVVVGYSLVGVYPCAVWKPRCPSCSSSTNNNNNTTGNSRIGPVRSRVANTARPHPYQHHHHQQQQYKVFSQPAPTTANTAAAGVQQTPQLLVTACSCREAIGTAPEYITQTTAVGTTPMIFVPFTVPNYITNGCSPSTSKVSYNYSTIFFIEYRQFRGVLPIFLLLNKTWIHLKKKQANNFTDKQELSHYINFIFESSTFFCGNHDLSLSI